MDHKIKIVNNQLMCLKQNHNEVVIVAIMDEQVAFEERFLCSKCMDSQYTSVDNVFSITNAIEIIRDKIQIKNREEEQKRNTQIANLRQFNLKMSDLQSKVVTLFDEIKHISEEWIKEIKDFKQKQDLATILQEYKQLCEEKNNSGRVEINNNYRSYFSKLELKQKKLTDIQEYDNCFKQLKSSLKNSDQNTEVQKILPEKNSHSVQLIHSVGQQSNCRAMAFNQIGNILTTTKDKEIKVWNFDNQKITELQTLTGHTDDVICLVFSKKSDWFFSGSRDSKIKSWQSNSEWKCLETVIKHTNYVYCLILNKNENQLLSCSSDKTIVAWKINNNNLQYDYQLENKHANTVQCISFNQNETALISCSSDKQIILWMKDYQNKWTYQHHILNDDYGYRICFIDDNFVAWQQYNQGITHVFQIINGQIAKKPELNIKLNESSCDDWLFPTIVNQQKQIILQKHNKWIYILQKKQDGKLDLLQAIELGHPNFGSLTNNGEYLVSWGMVDKELRIYKLQYQ